MTRIRLDQVTVEFPVFGANKSFRKALLQQAVGGLVRREAHHHPVVTALQAIDLTISEGDRIALVGHNGSGKSTLLRTMAGIYAPASGRITVRGRVSPLFNIWLGMNSEATGYDNILGIGMFCGMRPAQVRAKIDDIVDFAELGDFMHLPVRTYSAGMQLRLAFAVVTAIDPDILLLDEGFGTGDSRFAAKAEKRIGDLGHRSSVLVLTSHSETLLRKMCNKAVLLDHGRILRVGGIDEVLAAYHDSTAATA